MSPRFKVTSYQGAAYSWETLTDEAEAYAAANAFRQSGERVTVEQSYADDDGTEHWELIDEAAWTDDCVTA